MNADATQVGDTMWPAILSLVGVVVGALISNIAQFMLASRSRNEARDARMFDWRRKVYIAFLDPAARLTDMAAGIEPEDADRADEAITATELGLNQLFIVGPIDVANSANDLNESMKKYAATWDQADAARVIEDFNKFVREARKSLSE